MSAPDTDPNKQARQHRGPLRGMFAVVLWALVLLAGLAIWVFMRSGDPGDTASTQIEGSTGEVVETGTGDAVTANDFAEEEAGSAAATDPEADPSAVTVPSVTVTHPQSGQDDAVNPIAGDSNTAVPLDPVEEDAETE